ncbi:hypothetical protein ACBP93_08375 [Paenalcaligenes hominis]|uniref:Uncharacterized protein n=1 Tax=Paenalcaligenes hominis TaxID=643674 RepID=A0A1U9JYA6_9BURK|nr:hypothetical protein [Paenalcaligenes hominis]AQS50762.1 hypothetical protein PAEH1_02855 [Paenalcaligenes hominis]
MSLKTLTEAEFLKSIAEHEMRVLRDDGVYRHLLFKRAQTQDRYFELITTPGRLFYVGDMGDFAFERDKDMFNFFRTEPSESTQLPINVGYWHENLIMADTQGGSKEFDEVQVKSYVYQCLSDWLEGADSEDAQKIQEEVTELLEEIGLENNEHLILYALSSFDLTIGRHRLSFELWDAPSFNRPSHHFLWRLYAITWGIRQYDQFKAANEERGCSE